MVEYFIDNLIQTLDVNETFQSMITNFNLLKQKLVFRKYPKNAFKRKEKIYIYIKLIANTTPNDQV